MTFSVRQEWNVRSIDVWVGSIFTVALIISWAYSPSRFAVVAALSSAALFALTVRLAAVFARLDRYSLAMSLAHSTAFAVFLLVAQRLQLQYSWLTLFVGGEMVTYEVLYWSHRPRHYGGTKRRMRAVLSGYFLLSLVYLYL